MNQTPPRKMDQSLHWFPDNVSPGRLAATLVGMANSQGGTVLLGVSHSGHVQGVTNRSESLDKIFQASLLSDPPLVLPIPTVTLRYGSHVMEITVPKGLPYVYNLDGRYLIRADTRTVPLTARRLRQLLVERGVVKFESQIPPGAVLEDLDQARVHQYVTSVGPLGGDVEKFLLQRGCLKLDQGELRPTYAGLLLFSSQPQRWLPNATILAARFSGVAFADRYVKRDITGTLIDQLQQGEQFIAENMKSVVRMKGLRHEETTEYPPEAVRELLVNAIAHRDYNIQGDNIHLNIFADRIEVHSPGGLPGPVNMENLLKARFSRNAVIVQVLSDLGYIERLGYGLDRVVTAMQGYGLPAPRFEEVAGTFRVTLLGEVSQDQTEIDLSRFASIALNNRQEMALGFIVKKNRITNSDYQSLCPEVHSETLRRDLADMVSKGILIKVGDKKATYYILK